ncbi:MAG: hypothetical protein RL612_666, partial [Actinomycetota bacterium]
DINGLFDLAMSDEVASWHPDSEGKWSRHQFGEGGVRLIDVQDQIMKDVHAKRNAR